MLYRATMFTIRCIIARKEVLICQSAAQLFSPSLKVYMNSLRQYSVEVHQESVFDEIPFKVMKKCCFLQAAVLPYKPSESF